MRLCGAVYGNVNLTHWGKSRGVESSQVMLDVMMRDMVVQETLEITKRTGRMFGCFDRSRGMLLGWRTF